MIPSSRTVHQFNGTDRSHLLRWPWWKQEAWGMANTVGKWRLLALQPGLIFVLSYVLFINVKQRKHDRDIGSWSFNLECFNMGPYYWSHTPARGALCHFALYPNTCIRIFGSHDTSINIGEKTVMHPRLHRLTGVSLSDVSRVSAVAASSSYCW